MFMPRRILSPSGPAGSVEGAGATQGVAAPAVCGGLGGAPKLTEPLEKIVRKKRTKAANKPHRMTIPRIMEILHGQIRVQSRGEYSNAITFPECSGFRKNQPDGVARVFRCGDFLPAEGRAPENRAPPA